MWVLSPVSDHDILMTTEQSTPISAPDDDRFVHQIAPERSPSEAVIEAIAIQSDTDDLTVVADDLEPLYDAIDPTALDALFGPSATSDRSPGSVTFDYAGRRITVDTSGCVELTPAE